MDKIVKFGFERFWIKSLAKANGTTGISLLPTAIRKLSSIPNPDQ